MVGRGLAEDVNERGVEKTMENAKISKDGRFIMPRRFSEVMQMDAEWPGTLEQQWSVRRLLTLERGGNRWKLMKLLDKSVSTGRHYLTVGFLPDDMWPPNMNAIAGKAGMNFRDVFGEEGLRAMLPHELFHIVDKHLLTALTRLAYMNAMGIDTEINTWNWNVQETWADMGRDWWISDGQSHPWISELIGVV